MSGRKTELPEHIHTALNLSQQAVNSIFNMVLMCIEFFLKKTRFRAGQVLRDAGSSFKIARANPNQPKRARRPVLPLSRTPTMGDRSGMRQRTRVAACGAVPAHNLARTSREPLSSILDVKRARFILVTFRLGERSSSCSRIDVSPGKLIDDGLIGRAGLWAVAIGAPPRPGAVQVDGIPLCRREINQSPMTARAAAGVDGDVPITMGRLYLMAARLAKVCSHSGLSG
jgi:hypothetical protein